MKNLSVVLQDLPSYVDCYLKIKCLTKLEVAVIFFFFLMEEEVAFSSVIHKLFGPKASFHF